MSRNKFGEELLGISEEDNTDSLITLSENLMREFLKFGSETPDNLNCSEYIEYGLIKEPRRNTPKTVAGLKVKGKDIRVSEIVNMIEDIELPNNIKKHYPDLTEHEWNAVTRITTMVLMAFEHWLPKESGT